MFNFFRDNAVYRSNSFKFERRGPETNLPNLQSNPIDQVIETKKPVRSVKEVILKLKWGGAWMKSVVSCMKIWNDRSAWQIIAWFVICAKFGHVSVVLPKRKLSICLSSFKISLADKISIYYETSCGYFLNYEWHEQCFTVKPD